MAWCRFVVECRVDLEDARLAIEALAAIRTTRAAAAVLAELGSRCVPNIEGVLRRFREATSAAQRQAVP